MKKLNWAIIFAMLSFILLNGLASAQNETILLTEAEQNWLAQNHVVRARVGTVPPLHFFDGGNQGMSVDYLDLIATRIGFKVKYINDISWPEALQDIKNHQVIDVLLTAKNVKERRDFMLFTDDYLFMPWVVLTREKSTFVSSIEDLSGMKVSVEKNYVMHKKLADEYSNLQLILKESSLEALIAVSTGEADAYVGNLTISTDIIRRNNLTNLQVACPTPFDNHNQAFAVRNDWPELTSIINKALKTISPQEHTEIRKKVVLCEI